jgi:hypothetical protein
MIVLLHGIQEVVGSSPLISNTVILLTIYIAHPKTDGISQEKLSVARRVALKKKVLYASDFFSSCSETKYNENEILRRLEKPEKKTKAIPGGLYHHYYRESA